MDDDRYRIALEKIAGRPDCPKPIWNLVADALCWARKLTSAEILAELAKCPVCNDTGLELDYIDAGHGHIDVHKPCSRCGP